MYGVLARRNAVLILMSRRADAAGGEHQLHRLRGLPDAGDVHRASSSRSSSSSIAAAEVGLALAIVLRLFRNRQTANVDEADMMKW